MTKPQKIRQAAYNTRIYNLKQILKKIVLWPLQLCKRVWRFICRICKAIWNWLKSIDIVGMVNLTLLVAIIVLFTSLIINVTQCNKNAVNHIANNKPQIIDTRKVVQRNKVRKSLSTLPVQASNKASKTQIKTIGTKNSAVKAFSVPKQVLTGDVIVDLCPMSPVLYNGVKIDGNLFIQNMQRYTLPCGAKIEGNLFIRNVNKLSFCGAFTVKGNIYVSRHSSFGTIPSNARIGGQVIL